MPDSTSLVINATDANNKKISNNITYVNPNISNNTAIELAQRISALSSDSYQSTTRIDKTNVDKTKPARTLTSFTATANINFTLDGNTYKANVPVSKVAGSPPSFTINVVEPTLGNPAGQCCLMTNIDFPTGWRLFSNRLEFTSNRNSFYVTADSTPTAGPVLKATIIIPENDNYKELRLPFEVNIVADE